ncbi:MAG: 50S ribosomal protein L25 [Acidobacteriaceae bacterium]|nr:50S ribosomal protein L25 [Acidobacteriaceae bacterium]
MSNQTAPTSVVATPRTGTFNKNHARRVRVSGLIPAVVYGAGKPSIAVTVDPKLITRILHSDAGHNSIFDLQIEGGETGKAMIVDWQNEPIKGTLLHIDLKRIALDAKMKLSVPVHLVGTATGVKNQGGMLSQILHEVEIEALPGQIPAHIDVDITSLELNGSIHISDLPHSDNYKFLANDENQVVAHITAPKADAEADAAAGSAEPEVAKKGKKEEAK